MLTKISSAWLLCMLVLFIVLFLFRIISNHSWSWYRFIELDPELIAPMKGKLRKVIPPIHTRQNIGKLLQDDGLKTGVELGVQHGVFSKEILSTWKDCSRYVLVDVWRPLDNYGDSANKAQEEQEQIYKTAIQNTKRWERIIEVCRDFTVECAKKYRNEKFDYVYVDARHDYKGVLADLHAWWPLISEGGIMAGHDFVTQSEGPEQTGQDWTLNYDGTIDSTARAVFGAVVDFFNDPRDQDRYRQIYVTYKAGGWWTWVVRK